MARWGLVIDTLKCLGCYSCMISCKEEHFLPPNVFWSRVLISEEGKFPKVRKLIFPVQCNQCDDPACVEACPTGATSERDDGIVTIDYDQCVGCRYCLIACPYQQRTFIPRIDEYYPDQGLTEYEEFGQGMLQKGTVVKCNFCVERLDAGLEKGLVPGRDREATPACVIICPANARYFGDLDDPESEVSRLIAEKKAIQLHPEFGTDPSIYYIPH
ncbi:4Fe-4S dicluster domain-containing protein [Thermodesulfobacteriota bacterium]